MKRTMWATLAMCVAAAAVSIAADVNVGTWKLNPSKSKIGAGAARNETVKIETAGDSVKVTVDGKDAAGKPTHNEWTGKFDGKEYPVTGDPTADARSYKQVNDHSWTLAQKKGGTVITTGRIAVSPDGKTRTVTTTTTDPQGKKVSSTAVFDKQ